MTIQRKYFALAALAATAVFAQAQGQPDFSKVEIKATKLADNLYTLDGQGGTIGVLTGPDGVFMVDSQFAPLERQDRGEDQTDFRRRADQVHDQYARARRSHRRRRELRQDGRDHHLASRVAQSPGAS